jgi:hypothetical protein
MSEIVTHSFVDVELSETGWSPKGDMSYEQWEAAGRELQRMGRAWQWWVGDWILYGEQRYGETYAQAIDLTGMDYKTLMNVVSVARRVETSLRSESLSWSHHVVVAALPPAEQSEWLERAEIEGMTVARLTTALRSGVDPGPSPDPEPLIPTHRAQVTFLLAADSDDDAHELVKALCELMGRKGAQVTHKQANRIAG